MGVLATIAKNLDTLIGPGVTLLYPLYATMRAIENSSALDDQQWLTYWVLYSLITLFDLFCWKVLAWIPIWPYLKLFFCMWLVLPKFNGAAYIYENIMRKYVKPSESLPPKNNQLLVAKIQPWREEMDYNTACKNKKKKTIDQSMLLCCKLFISESRNLAVLDAIERAARLDPESVIVNKFEDRAYNRVRYTIVSYVLHDSTGSAIYSPLQQTVVAMAEAAFGAINLEQHSGAHPRLGVVDDIVFHPLARASLDEAAWLAKAVAVDIGNKFQVPVYLYAAAHPTGKALDTIRRELGYYRPNFMGNQWAGWTMPGVLQEKPDEGPTTVSPTRGIAMIGARPWVDLYNIPILSANVAATQRIARKVSARGGGLPTVQTLGLVHGEDSTEIACMLLEPNQIGAERVQNRVEMLAAEEGLYVKKGYFTDHSPDMVIEKYMKLISADRN